MTPDTAPATPTFDVFLSYNGKDRAQVQGIAERLRRAGVSPWFDQWCLTPGGDYQPELFAGLQASGACAYFVGPHGEGDWSRMELGVARSRAAKERAFRLFPVLLPGLPEPFDRTTLPPFLSHRTWVDFRAGVHDRVALQALINAISGVPSGLPPVEPTDGGAPYRGLLPFGETDAEFFFGRDADIQRLVEKLRGDRFLAVLGPSGSGKSSVVSAGLVPALRTGAIAGSERWPIRALRPGALPLTALAAELADATGRPAGGVLDELAADERTLHLATEALLRGQAAEARVCWVVDQAEELFTLCHDDAERAAFIDNVAYAAAIPGGRTTVILTMRADFYARLSAYPNLAALVADSQYLVSPLDADGLRAAIEEPAHRVGLEFEEGLTETILSDVVDRPGTLPLLEHALLELWQRRRGSMLTLEGYRASGGVEGALAQRAEATYDSFSAEEQEVVRRALLRLTEPGEGTEDTRRRAPMSELTGSLLQADALETVINRLADARLVTVSSGGQHADAWVDLSHEALIRGWPRIRAWINEDRESLRTHRRLTEAAADWHRAGRDRDLLYRGARLAEATEWRTGREADLNDLEQAFLDGSVQERDAAAHARDRRRRLVTAASLVLLAVFVSLTALAGIQWIRAEESAATARAAAAEAEAERDRADDAAKVAEDAAAEAEAERDRADDAAKVAEDQRREADAQRRVALSRQLATYAVSSLSDVELSLLLSLEAVRVADTVEARGSLLAALVTDPTRLMATLRDVQDFADIEPVAFSPDSGTVAAVTGGKEILLWDTELRRPMGTLKRPDDTIESIAFSLDGRTIATAGFSQEVTLWDVGRRERTGTLSGGNAVAFSPDGKVLASGGGDHTVILWDIQRGEQIGKPMPGHHDFITSLAFSPDGGTLASSSWDHTIRLWDVERQRSIGQPLLGHSDWVTSVTFSPDGRTLASAGKDDSIVLWDVARGEKVNALGGEAALTTLGGIAWSPDGRTLAAALGGHGKWATIIYDVEGLQQIGRLPQEGPVNSIAWSPNGRLLASGDGYGGLALWDMRLDSWMQTACQVAGRSLTEVEWQRYLGTETYRETCPGP